MALFIQAISAYTVSNITVGRFSMSYVKCKVLSLETV